MKQYTHLRQFYAWTGFILWVAIATLLIGLGIASIVSAPEPVKIIEKAGAAERQSYTGLASYYDYDLPDAKDYSKTHRTAASRDYPRGTMVEVQNLKNGKTTCVRTNDFVENFGVIIDLSSLAFSDIAPLDHGLISVKLTEGC